MGPSRLCLKGNSGRSSGSSIIQAPGKSLLPSDPDFAIFPAAMTDRLTLVSNLRDGGLEDSRNRRALREGFEFSPSFPNLHARDVA